MDHEVSRGERASACHIPVQALGQASQPEKRKLGPYLAFYVHGSCKYHTRHLVCIGHSAEHLGLRCSKTVPRGQQSYVLSLRGLRTQLRLVSSSSEGSSIGCPSALKANRILGGSEFLSDQEFRLQTPPLPPSLVSVRWPSVVASPVPLSLQWERKKSKTLSSEHIAQPGTLQCSPPSSRAQGGDED